MKATVNLDGLHKLASFHRRAVERAPRVGCFCCIRFFKPSEIEDWTDVRKVRKGRIRGRVLKRGEGRVVTLAELQKLPQVEEGQTAICPQCSVDAIIPDRTYGFRLTKALLVALCFRWFRPVREGRKKTLIEALLSKSKEGRAALRKAAREDGYTVKSIRVRRRR